MSFNTGATEIPILIDNKQATGTVNEGVVVKVASGDFDIVTVATSPLDAPFGIARNSASSGDRVSVLRAGRAVCAASGGPTAHGQPLLVISGSTGQVATYAAAMSGTGLWSIGTADTPTATSGQMIGAMLGFFRLSF